MKPEPCTVASGLSSRTQFVLLSPHLYVVPDGFADAIVNKEDHERLLAAMQRLRAQIYLEDGAIRKDQVTSDGRHVHPADHDSWHLLAVAPDGVMQGCARYRCHEAASFHRLSVSRSAMAICDRWGVRLRHAIEADIAEAKRRGIPYVEVGGWALTPDLRCSTEALRIALATWALARILGGCLGVTTATRRHCSASILRKIGGRPLISNGQELPSYYDPAYGCEMEVLRFDSDLPNPRFECWIEQWVRSLGSVPVCCALDGAGLLKRPAGRSGLYAPATL